MNWKTGFHKVKMLRGILVPEHECPLRLALKLIEVFDKWKTFLVLLNVGRMKYITCFLQRCLIQQLLVNNAVYQPVLWSYSEIANWCYIFENSFIWRAGEMANNCL